MTQLRVRQDKMAKREVKVLYGGLAAMDRASKHLLLIWTRTGSNSGAQLATLVLAARIFKIENRYVNPCRQRIDPPVKKTAISGLKTVGSADYELKM